MAISTVIKRIELVFNSCDDVLQSSIQTLTLYCLLLVLTIDVVNRCLGLGYFSIFV